jgi:hypothetical protein
MKTAARNLAAALSVTCTTVPCFAQDNMSFAHSEQRTGAFAGVNLRLELGQHRRAKPVARIALGLARETGGGAASDTRRNSIPTLELGLKKSGGPELFIAGQPTARVNERLGARGLRLSPVEIVFGVTLLAVGVLVITSLDDLGKSVPQL